MKTEYIEFVFENVESIVVPIERVSNIKLENERPDEILPLDQKVSQADGLEMEIEYYHKNELTYFNETDEPLGMFINSPVSNSVSDRPHILGRLFGRDVVNIEYLDEFYNVIDTIYLPWGDLEYYNQYLYITAENGIISININENNEPNYNPMHDSSHNINAGAVWKDIGDNGLHLSFDELTLVRFALDEYVQELPTDSQGMKEIKRLVEKRTKEIITKIDKIQ